MCTDITPVQYALGFMGVLFVFAVVYTALEGYATYGKKRLEDDLP